MAKECTSRTTPKMREAIPLACKKRDSSSRRIGRHNGFIALDSLRLVIPSPIYLSDADHLSIENESLGAALGDQSRTTRPSVDRSTTPILRIVPGRLDLDLARHYEVISAFFPKVSVEKKGKKGKIRMHVKGLHGPSLRAIWKHHV
jgi:hypothetical protein